MHKNNFSQNTSSSELTGQKFEDIIANYKTDKQKDTEQKVKDKAKSDLQKKLENIPNTIVKFIAAFCENSAFKPSWWNSLSVSKKSQLIKYQRLNIEAVSYTQIFDEFSKDTRQYVKWTIKKIQKSF